MPILSMGLADSAVRGKVAGDLMTTERKKLRIGLAFSGGGFRASLFHLGVIRRLEELDIMKDVEVISTVSGGSIIGAYYLVQFEKEQRASEKPCNRLEICDLVIEKFYKAISRNMRMRAMVFAPVFHPIAFGKFVLSRGKSHTRTDRMGAEFSDHFFSPNLKVGDLPLAPKLLINATSNSEGKRVVFSKRGLSKLSSQIADADNSQLPLEKAVGASAAVPGLFPPVAIAGDMCSDGGVVDNQGLESLFDYFELTDRQLNRLKESDRAAKKVGDQIVIICSDASGQIKIEDVPKQSGIASAARSMDILQAGNRTKNIKLLKEIKEQSDKDDIAKGITEFAFFHLSSNVKDWQNETIGAQDYKTIDQRLCSEFIQPVTSLRTDLDDFDLLESFSLMYHGYTLVNWHIASFCPELKKNYDLADKLQQFGDPSSRWGIQFLAHKNLIGVVQGKGQLTPQQKRDFIVQRLDVGSEMFFRNVQKKKKVFVPLLSIVLLPLLLLLVPVFSPGTLVDTWDLEKYVFYYNGAADAAAAAVAVDIAIAAADSACANPATPTCAAATAAVAKSAIVADSVAVAAAAWAKVPNPGNYLATSIMDALRALAPFDLKRFFALEKGRWGNIPIFFSDLVVFSFLTYLSLLVYWLVNRGLVRKMYREDYEKVSPPNSKVPFS